MCLECEKKVFVKCIKAFQEDGLELFTVGKTYGCFTWYFENEDYYNLTAMDNRGEECNIANSEKDDVLEFSKDGWFIEHFEIISHS
jgi:hypothetical protein